MKFRLLLSLLAIFLIAKGLGWCEEPQSKPVTSPQATIECEVMQPTEEPGIWYVHVITTEFSGVHVHRVMDPTYKSRKRALNECDRLVGQWENLYQPKRKKSR